MKNIKEVNINDIDLENAYFHYTLRSNLENIDREGLKAIKGDASKMVDDVPRVCMSIGGKGILGMKNSFLYEFTKLRICDIPIGYRKYFDFSEDNYKSTEIVRRRDVYMAMKKRFEEEVYLKVDAKEGEDYLKEEMHGFTTSYDIKGKENHDIDVDKLSLVVTENGDSVLEVIKYIFNLIIKKNPEQESLIREMNKNLSEMLYVVEVNSKGIFSDLDINKKDKETNRKGLLELLDNYPIGEEPYEFELTEKQKEFNKYQKEYEKRFGKRLRRYYEITEEDTLKAIKICLEKDEDIYEELIKKFYPKDKNIII